jgi:hypothetical protein
MRRGMHAERDACGEGCMRRGGRVLAGSVSLTPSLHTFPSHLPFTPYQMDQMGAEWPLCSAVGRACARYHTLGRSHRMHAKHSLKHGMPCVCSWYLGNAQHASMMPYKPPLRVGVAFRSALCSDRIRCAGCRSFKAVINARDVFVTRIRHSAI